MAMPLWDFELLPDEYGHTILAEGQTEDEAAAAVAAYIPTEAWFNSRDVTAVRPGTLVPLYNELKWRELSAAFPYLGQKVGRMGVWARRSRAQDVWRRVLHRVVPRRWYPHFRLG